jgi:hypothetical protein
MYELVAAEEIAPASFHIHLADGNFVPCAPPHGLETLYAPKSLTNVNAST